MAGKIDFNRLRRAGVKHYYKTLKKGGKDSEEAVKETASKFRLGKRTVRDILGDTTQPAGEKPPEEQSAGGRLMDLIEQMERVNPRDILIDNKVPKLVDECFKVLDERKDFKSENERIQMKEKFLDNIIEQPLSWAVDKFLKAEKKVNSTALNVSTENNLADQIKKMKEEDPRAREERQRQAKEEYEKERKRYLDNFEDPDNGHTPEQKLDVKREKLFKFIEGIKENLTEEQKTEIVEHEKWLEEQNKPKKQREQPWSIIREEKSMHLRKKISLWPKKPSKRGWVTNASERRRIKRERRGGDN